LAIFLAASIAAALLIDPHVVPWHKIDVGIVICGGVSAFTAISKFSTVEPKNILPLLQEQVRNELRFLIKSANYLPRILASSNSVAWAQETSNTFSRLTPDDLPVLSEAIIGPLPSGASDYDNQVRSEFRTSVAKYVDLRTRLSELEGRLENLSDIETIFIFLAPWLISLAIALALFKAINKP
jgi:hypothetical protein